MGNAGSGAYCAQVLRVVAGVFNLTLLFPCACGLGFVGWWADWGVHSQWKSLVVGFLYVSAGGLNLLALLGSRQGDSLEAWKAAAIAGNVIAVAGGVLMSPFPEYNVLHLMPLDVIAILSVVAVLSRRNVGPFERGREGDTEGDTRP